MKKFFNYILNMFSKSIDIQRENNKSIIDVWNISYFDKWFLLKYGFGRFLKKEILSEEIIIEYLADHKKFFLDEDIELLYNMVLNNWEDILNNRALKESLKKKEMRKKLKLKREELKSIKNGYRKF